MGKKSETAVPDFVTSKRAIFLRKLVSVTYTISKGGG